MGASSICELAVYGLDVNELARPYRMSRSALILRACESFDFRDSRHESNQALTTPEIAEKRIDSHSLRSAVEGGATRRMGRLLPGRPHPSIRRTGMRLLRMRAGRPISAWLHSPR